ncbi:hypothetical protein SELR_11380 [Selenomonas ruminantium subsp. lactilytica TAM6421]|uniref:Uncharacterized protein n=1 Tax=Selenomonas ruminantium subsp. lactilytica (strain NBRC 103574 / TAM6421) TaxID=927704 RepID=I0GQ09_SELRL|nr:hypothetical protein [Selenomonas ruminantium]BAL82846.1 hypothetical protein SELR_11380 [Selenomonas ruminantium subsp. lactilytica TAM6421]
MEIGLRFNGTDSFCTIPVSVTNTSSWEMTIDLVTDDSSSSSNYIYHQSCIFGYDSGGYKSRDFHVDIKSGKLFIFSGLLGSNNPSQVVSGTITNGNGDFGWDTDRFIADGAIHTIRVTYENSTISVYLDNEYLGYLNTTRTINSSELYIGSSYTGEKVYARFDLYNFKLKIDNAVSVQYQPTLNTVSNMILEDGSGNNNDGTLSGTFSTVESNFVVVYADTERIIDVAAITVDADTARKVRNAQYEWRYENPGSAELLTITGGTTVTDVAESVSLTGEAFYQPTRSACFDIPATKEIWIRCDIFFSNIYANNNRIRIYNDNSTYSVNGFSTDPTTTNNYGLWHNNTRQLGNYCYAKSNRYQFLMHMLSDSTDGLIEIWTGKEHLSYTGNVNGGLDFDNVYIQMDGANIYVSNLIISNVELSIGEGAHVEYFDTEREITIPGLDITVDVDIERTLKNAVIVNADTSRIVGINVIVDVDTVVDVSRSAAIVVDVERQIVQTVNMLCDVLRKIPHTITDNSSVLQSVSISLAEQQLVDDVSFTATIDAAVLDNVSVTHLDYVANVCIEETSQRGILMSCKCTADIEEILYQQLAYEIPQTEYEWSGEYLDELAKVRAKYPDYQIQAVASAAASTHIESIAENLGLSLHARFDDWISTLETKSVSGTNYAGLISELFGWTARIPTLMINCYMRDGVLYVIQRGHEDNTVTLDGQHLTVHTTSQKLVRMMWGSDPWSKTEVTTYKGVKYWDEYQDMTPVNPEEDADTSKTFNDDGLVQTTTVVHGNQMVTTYYTYTEQEDGKKFLSQETAVTTENGVEVDRVTTYHDPVRNTQSHVYSVDESGVLGGVVTSSNNDDRVTPYAKGNYTGYSDGFLFRSGGQVYWASGLTHYGEEYEQGQLNTTLHGISLIDTSFPIDGESKLEEITNAIKALDRKTEEVITVELYDYPHLIDFNDKIIFHGHTYYLRSNSAIANEHIVNRQTLQFVRWY